MFLINPCPADIIIVSPLKEHILTFLSVNFEHQYYAAAEAPTTCNPCASVIPFATAHLLPPWAAKNEIPVLPSFARCFVGRKYANRDRSVFGKSVHPRILSLLFVVLYFVIC